MNNTSSSSSATYLRKLYLQLMKKALLNSIHGEIEDTPVENVHGIRKQLLRVVGGQGTHLVKRREIRDQDRQNGNIYPWPLHAHTMIGEKRLDNLWQCMSGAIESGVEGDVIETGVWRGGATIFMRAVFKAYGITDRSVWVADSFQGLPPPNAEMYPADAGDSHYVEDGLRVTLEQVQQNFAKYDLLDNQVKFLKGWFKDTLPTSPISKLAVMRLDGDMYESTMDALNALYPKLSIGGYVIVDDFGYLKSCEQAVNDYRNRHGISDPIERIDWTGAFWRRTK